MTFAFTAQRSQKQMAIFAGDLNSLSLAPPELLENLKTFIMQSLYLLILSPSI